MGEIYRGASQVILYLGPAAHHDADGIDLITLLYNHFKPSLQPILDMTWFFAYRRSKPLPVERLPDSVSIEHPGWPGLLELAFGAWTERTWIVQENVMNQNTFMLRGQSKLDWVSVAAISVFFGVKLLPISLLREIRESKNSSLDCYIDAVCHSLDIRLKNSGSTSVSITAFEGFLTTLEGNLQWYDALDCADPRDHIYSIMALSTDIERLGIVPDYSQSVQTVFVDATVRMLKYYRSFQHLHYVSLLDNLSEPSYPSWSWTPRLFGRQHYLDFTLYKAHPVTHTEFKFDQTLSELTVKGRILDRISFSVPGILVRGSTFWGITELVDACRLVTELSALATILRHIGTNRLNIGRLLLALIAEKFRDSDGLQVRKDLVISLWCYLRFSWLTIAENRESLPEDARNALQLIEDVIADVANLAGKQAAPDLTEDEWNIGKQVSSQKCSYGRSFGVTQQNRIVNFTFKAKVGDDIALLQSGSLPYILRPAGDRYQFVGDVCVPDMMYGEAYADLVPDNVDYEIHLI